MHLPTPNLLLAVLTAVFVPAAGVLAATRITPQQDSQVIEVLPAITQNRPNLSAGTKKATSQQVLDPAAAARSARQDISIARQTGDTRYWGRAQAQLQPWWDKADAPVELAVLQATVQQGRHEFAAARQVLTAALARTPGHAQGWLNLASLERLSARYADSLAACAAVERAGQPLYAQACRLETQSLQGQQPAASRGLQALVEAVPDAGQRSWLLSLLAENHERQGDDRAAGLAYSQSLALQPDLYTSIAYSDFLLRTGKTAQALKLLADLPETDAVLLRRATAWRRLDDKRWLQVREELRQREAELQRRGDDISLHGREAALVALWLDDKPAQALQLARRNLQLQREPLDWWVALASARLAGDAAALGEIEKGMADTGLVDVRLQQKKKAGLNARP